MFLSTPISERKIKFQKLETSLLFQRRALTDPKAAANPNAPRVTFHDAGAKSHMSLIIGCDTTLSQQGRLRVSGSYLTMSKETNSKFGLAQ